MTEVAASMSAVRGVRTALRGLGGRATVGDVSTATGLAGAEAEATLRRLLEDYRGHLEVGERGDLVYRFSPKLLRRDALPWWERTRERAYQIFKSTFKVGIAVMLVVYVLIFVALLIAAMLASQNRDSNRGGWGGGRRRRGQVGMPFGNFWLWYLIWSPGWGWRRPYYGARYVPAGGRKRDRHQGPPFYKKVFAFVFGPDHPQDTPERRDRRLLRLIRSRRGALTAAEMVQLTGMGLQEAEEELTRLMVAHDGDARVSDNGTLVYVFPQLMVSAHGPVSEHEAAPAWRRMEPRLPFTGNTSGTDALVAGLNGFNLIAAATAPMFIFPRLGLTGPLAWVGLVWIPLAFSAVFFAVPALRWVSVARENTRRVARNVRKVLLGLVSRATLDGPTDLPMDEATAEETVRRALGNDPRATRRVPEELNRLVAEFDGEVEPDEQGGMSFRFPWFRQTIAAAHLVREKAALDRRQVGRVVYDSADDAVGESRKELESFDEALAAGGSFGAPEKVTEGPGRAAGSPADRTGNGAPRRAAAGEPLALPAPDALRDYMADPDRFAFRDELEIAALEEEMKRQETARRVRRA